MEVVSLGATLLILLISSAVIVLLLVSAVVYFGSYRVLKFPVLVVLASLVLIEFLLYLALRYAISTSEFLFGKLSLWLSTIHVVFRPHSRTARHQWLKEQEPQCDSYEEWRRVASELDEIEGRQQWKEAPSSRFYDAPLLAGLVEEIRTLLQPGDDDRGMLVANHARLRDALLAAAHKNIAGIENPELYAARTGTKALIEEYIAALSTALREYQSQCQRDMFVGAERVLSSSSMASVPDFLSSRAPVVDGWTADGELVSDERMMTAYNSLEFFKRLRRAYGRVGLCLSGGASFGNFHWGIIAALLETNELPAVLSGTSAGAFAAAFVCTRTNAELAQQLSPGAVLPVMQGLFDESLLVMLRRLVRRGGLLDNERVEAKLLAMTNGPCTFLEAYRRTGRHLNISVQPTGKYRTTVVFNHLTAPDVVVASAIMASAAIPFVLQDAVVLKKKTPTGEIVPYQAAGVKWSDGSFQGDLPMQTLRELFGVTYFVVSQVNPHIVPFFFKTRVPAYSKTRGRSWRGGFLGSLFEYVFKLEMQKNLKIIADLDLLPSFFGQNWSNLFLQEFEGQTTITPSIRLCDYAFILSDPTRQRLQRYFQVGRTEAWRRISQIRTRSVIARAIEECERLAHAHYKRLLDKYQSQRRCVFSPSRTPRSRVGLG